MNDDHVISEKLLEEINRALANGENWMAYNAGTYFLEAAEVNFFKIKDEAYEFAENNISDYDCFKVIHFNSVADLLRQVPYGTALERKLSNPDANGLYNKDGNEFTDALIDHWENQQIINNKKYKIMNDKNFEF